MKENIEEVIERLEKGINDVWFSTLYSQEDEERDLQILLSDYKKVLEDKRLFKHRLEVADEFIESRKPNLTPEHYDDLKYILNECDLDSTW